MTARVEQETVTAGRDDLEVYVWTNNPVDLRRLRKDSRSIEIDGAEDWGRFRIPSAVFHPLKGFRRTGRALTPEQREAASARLAAARAVKL